MRRFVIPTVLTLSTAMTLLVNALANLLPFNNITTAQVSDSYPVLFVPAGYVFSIWGAIYVALIIVCAYSWVAPVKKAFTWTFTRWYVIACLANSMWLIAWHYKQISLTILIILVFLVSLIRIYQLVAHGSFDSIFERLAKRTAWSLYLGWVSVATIANMTVFLYTLGWQGKPFPAAFWAAALILVAAILGMIYVKFERNFVFAAVIVWAIVGIAMKFPQNAMITLPVLVAVWGIGWTWFSVVRGSGRIKP